MICIYFISRSFNRLHNYFIENVLQFQSIHVPLPYALILEISIVHTYGNANRSLPIRKQSLQLTICLFIIKAMFYIQKLRLHKTFHQYNNIEFYVFYHFNTIFQTAPFIYSGYKFNTNKFETYVGFCRLESIYIINYQTILM